MGKYNNVGYKHTDKINLDGCDLQDTLKDIRDSIQVLSTDDLNTMRNPMYQFMI